MARNSIERLTDSRSATEASPATRRLVSGKLLDKTWTAYKRAAYLPEQPDPL